MNGSTACLALALVTALPPLQQTDDVGRTVVIERPVRRIVSTAPSITETLFAIGAGERVVGVTRYCESPEEARALPRVGDFATLDLEKILELQPDLVVTTWLAQKRWVAALEERGLLVYVVFPGDLSEVMSSIERLGRVVGQEAEARELVADMRGRLEVLGARVEQQESRPRVFVAVTMSPLFTAGPGSTLHEVITLAGGENVFSDLDKPYAPVTAESVLARDPQVILLAHEVDQGEGRRIVAEAPGLGATSAARSGRVIDWIDPSLLVHPNHRLVDGIEALRRALAKAGSR